MKSIRAILFLVAIVVGAILFFSSKGDYPRPTSAFYVNDFADVLMMATRSTITREGERLYDMTQDETDGGAQLVFATFAVDSSEEIAEYDKTEIYRQWKIGKDDMGALVLLFFIDGVLEETQIEVGYRMETYLTPTFLGQAVDSTLYSSEWVDQLDMAVANLLYVLLERIYVDAYGYDSFNYDMDTYYDYLINYDGSSDYDITPMDLIVYLLSPFSSSGDKWLFGLLAAFVILYGGGSVLGNRGAGGSSGGMGIFRRRH